MIKLTADRVCPQMAAVLEQPAEATVHSVFASSLNLRMGEQLITLLAPYRPLFPSSAVLESAPPFSDLDLPTGSPVVRGANTLTLGGCLRVDFHAARHCDLSVQSLHLSAVSDMKKRMYLLAQVIGESQLAGEGLAPILPVIFPGILSGLAPNLWSSHLATRLEQLYHSLRERTAAHWRELGQRLAGCGPGLTPSSDDLLTGVIAVLLAGAKAGCYPARLATEAATGLSQGAAAHTNDISGGFLRNSGAGFFGEVVLQLLTQLYSPLDEQQLVRSARAVLDFGSTSGSDILTGILLGLGAVHQTHSL